jgi:hypothetical protein
MEKQAMTTPILSPSRVHIGYAGHYWSTYQCIAEESHSPEDAQTPGYWAHVAAARKLRTNDIFEVRCETGAWMLDLIVIEAGQRFARVKVLRTADVEQPAADAKLSSVVVEFKGPVKKHCIIRLVDRAIIKEGIASKADAIREAAEYEQRLAA